MERTKKTEPGKIRWKKTGGGSFRLSNLRFIKSGQIFEAFEYEIPAAFRDTVIPLDPLPSKALAEKKEKKLEEVAEAASSYSLKPRGGGGWYDVVDKEGKVMNEKALKQEAAEELIKQLGA